MQGKMKIVLSLIFLGFVSGFANAAGFSLYEWSARGNAMGGAVIANKAEPASIASNPALIANLEGVQVQAGTMFVGVSAKTSVAGIERATEDKIFYIPNAYLTSKINDNVYFGVGLFSRFGLGETYKNYKTWGLGSVISYYANLETISVNPNIAVKINDDLSFAMGLEVMTLSFEEKKYLAASEFSLKGNSISWGGNFGAYYNPSFAKKWAAGLTYRAKVRHVAQGEVETSGIFADLVDSGDASAALTLPDSLSFGLSFSPLEELIVEADIIGTFWSSYKRLRIDYDDTDKGFLSEDKNYRDVFRFNLGAQYSINESWDIRAGYSFDQSPINKNYMDTLVPAHDRNIFSLGAGYAINNWSFDASYSLVLAADLSGKGSVLGDETTVKYKDSSSNIIGINAKYAF